MTSLFQILERSEIVHDPGNDALLSTDDGYVWEVPTTQATLTPERLTKLVIVAYAVLGSVFRGFEVRAFKNNGIEEYRQLGADVTYTHHLVIYVSEAYTE